MTSAELPMGVSLAVAGIRTAVSATRQSQINAGVRRDGEKEIENLLKILERRGERKVLEKKKRRKKWF